MSTTNRVTTRSKNSSQHPGLLVPKQIRRTSDEVAGLKKAKEDAKKQKEDAEKAIINRVAEFEQNQAQNDAMEETPRVHIVRKPKPLVRTRSYADVLRAGSDMEMEDGTAGFSSTIELATVNAGQTTDDGMETAVQDLPKKKNVRFFFLLSLSESTYKTKGKERKTRKPSVRDAIKTIQDVQVPVKKALTSRFLKRKSIVIESSDSDSIQKNPVTPIPNKKTHKSKAPTDSDDDLPAGPPEHVVRPALTNKGDDSENDLPPKKGAKKNKGKGKAFQRPDKKGKATDKDPDQTRDPTKAKMSVFIHLSIYHHPVTCLCFH